MPTSISGWNYALKSMENSTEKSMSTWLLEFCVEFCIKYDHKVVLKNWQILHGDIYICGIAFKNVELSKKESESRKNWF